MRGKLVLLIAFTMAGCSPAAGELGSATAQTLDSVLVQQGFVRVPMERLPTGHFAIAGTASDLSLDLIVDTGASHTVLDVERAARFDLTTEDRGSRASGVGLSSQSVQSGRLADVAIGPVRFETLPVSVLDLSEVNRILERLGNAPVDGIIGADVLMARSAVIDYGTLGLYFKAE